MYSVFNPATSEVVDLFDDTLIGEANAQKALATYPEAAGYVVKFLDPDSPEADELLKNEVFVESMSQHVLRILFEDMLNVTLQDEPRA